ncbi:hypothetical protein ACU4HD_43945 [Cupriavidus basilensis]
MGRGQPRVARNIATADAIQYQINHINPNDPTLSAQDKALATNDPVQFACVQLARPHANDKNAEQIYEQIGAASYDVRVNYTKDQVAAKMKAGDAQGALKILSTNMNDVSVTSADPDARDHLYQVAGAPSSTHTATTSTSRSATSPRSTSTTPTTRTPIARWPTARSNTTPSANG